MNRRHSQILGGGLDGGNLDLSSVKKAELVKSGMRC